MTRLLALLPFLFLGCHSFATNRIEFSDGHEAQGLTCTNQLNSPYTTAAYTQLATFNLTVVHDDPPEGFEYDHVQWNPTYPFQSEGQTVPVPGTVWIPNGGTAESTVGYAFEGPGVYTASCVIYWVATDGSGAQTQTAVTKDYVAFGGPLQMGVYGQNWQVLHNKTTTTFRSRGISSILATILQAMQSHYSRRLFRWEHLALFTRNLRAEP